MRFSKVTNANDGDPRTTWAAGAPTADRPAWVAIDVGVGPARVLFSWSSAGSYNYNETDYGSPGAYRVETSRDSTNGADGLWSVVASVPTVVTHSGTHSFDFTGQRWVKLVVTRAPDVSPNGVQIDEVEVRDVSRGVSDTWLFMGDSITAFAFGRPMVHDLTFAEIIRARHPPHTPAMINGGVGGDKSEEAVRHLDEWIAMNKDMRFWCIGYGTNDAAGDSSDTSRFRSNLRILLQRVRDANHVPIVASIPYASDGQHRNIPRFNEVIDELRDAFSLSRGPDLYAWFLAHPEELRDGVHPNERGVGSINRLWADAVDALYAH